jgi:hypothetical protein
MVCQTIKDFAGPVATISQRCPTPRSIHVSRRNVLASASVGRRHNRADYELRHEMGRQVLVHSPVFDRSELSPAAIPLGNVFLRLRPPCWVSLSDV